MNHKELLTKKEQKIFDLIHHMHHYLDNNEIIHELHHCYLFAKPNMKGKRYSVDHKILNKKLSHIIVEENPPEILYDHLSNAFRIKEQTIIGIL